MMQLTAAQAEYLLSLVDRQSEREQFEARMLSKELGEQSPAFQRALKRAERTFSVRQVVGQEVDRLQRLEAVRKLSGVAL
jgi:hypothetical protein